MILYRKLRRIIGIFLRVRWIPTIYINLKLLPIKQAIHLPFVVKGKVKFRSLTGKVNFRCPLRLGIVQIGKDVDEMPISLVPTQIRMAGTLVVSGPVIINKGANFIVWPNAIMNLGEYVMICSGVTVKAVQNIEIGNHAMISSGCFIMDSNIHCIRNHKDGTIKRTTNPIKMGNNVWMSMGAALLGGAVIPDNCILARNSFVNKDITSIGSGVYAGAPAKLVRPNASRLISFAKEYEVNKFFSENPSEEIYKTESGEEKIEDSSVALFYRV